jgi:hypothetical protein
MIDERTFIETFLYHFREGLNGEYATANLPMFRSMVDKLKTIRTTKELGGH